MMDGGIFGDDEGRKKVEAVVGITSSKKEKARKKVKDEDALFPDGDDLFKEILPPQKVKKEKSERKSKASRVGKKVELPEDLLDEYNEMLEDFSPEFANKKQIRNFRKLLTKISLIKYPKKPKEKKAKKKK